MDSSLLGVANVHSDAYAPTCTRRIASWLGRAPRSWLRSSEAVPNQTGYRLHQYCARQLPVLDLLHQTKRPSVCSGPVAVRRKRRFSRSRLPAPERAPVPGRAGLGRWAGWAAARERNRSPPSRATASCALYSVARDPPPPPCPLWRPIALVPVLFVVVRPFICCGRQMHCL